MRFPIILACILLFVNLLVDLYVYAAAHSYSRGKFLYRLQGWSALALGLILIASFVLVAFKTAVPVVMWALFAYLSIYVFKYAFVVFDVLSRIPLLFRRLRWKWMTKAGIWVGIALFGLMWWGALVNRYRVQTREVEIVDPAVPQGFNGFTVAQISDLHVGTYGHNTAFVDKLVREINALHPDLIVFTGDLVNQRSEELKPFLQALSKLYAPMGVYSVMGNHDYGDYTHWRDESEHAADEANLKKMEASMGWRMLNNAHAVLRHNGDSIVLIGVENIGDPPFRVAGDLRMAYPRIGDDSFKILLSHNPAHWAQDIRDKSEANIHLTLAGHTHAMQIELFGLSPAVWRYPYWGGLYSDSRDKRLYVNIGTGEVAFPARIGATPEITLFTFKSSK